MDDQGLGDWNDCGATEGNCRSRSRRRCNACLKRAYKIQTTDEAVERNRKIAEAERKTMNEPKKVSKEGSDGMLAEAMLQSMTGGDVSQPIYDQEARGQQSMATSDQLPVEGSPGHYMYGRDDEAADKGWLATGIEFGPVEKGELFRNAMLPEGWKKVTTDHAMWCDLVDDQGRKRASIFYKAAYYDRKAHMHLERRFYVSEVYGENTDFDAERDLVFEVTDSGKQVFASKSAHVSAFPGHDDREKWNAWKEESDAAKEKVKDECLAWLKEHGFEDYENPGAYWS